jgi:hypothetical protein
MPADRRRLVAFRTDDEPDTDLLNLAEVKNFRPQNTLRKPVFVDPSGRRRRAIRLFALSVSSVLVCVALLLVTAMVDAQPRSPLLPLRETPIPPPPSVPPPDTEPATTTTAREIALTPSQVAHPNATTKVVALSRIEAPTTTEAPVPVTDTASPQTERQPGHTHSTGRPTR